MLSVGTEIDMIIWFETVIRKQWRSIIDFQIPTYSLASLKWYEHTKKRQRILMDDVCVCIFVSHVVHSTSKRASQNIIIFTSYIENDVFDEKFLAPSVKPHFTNLLFFLYFCSVYTKYFLSDSIFSFNSRTFLSLQLRICCVSLVFSLRFTIKKKLLFFLFPTYTYYLRQSARFAIFFCLYYIIAISVKVFIVRVDALYKFGCSNKTWKKDSRKYIT